VVIPDILLRLSFRRFKLESRQGWTFFVVEVFHPQGIEVQAGSLYPIFVPYSTLYSTAIAWLLAWARPAIQLHHETTIPCLLFKAMQTSRASFLILCEGETREFTTFVNKWHQQNQTGSMNMLSEFCNAPQSPYPVPSFIHVEQRKISDRGLPLASNSTLHP
jgi:hypothetical protein